MTTEVIYKEIILASLAKVAYVYEVKSPSNSSSNSKDRVYITRTGSKYYSNNKCKGLSSASKVFESTKQEAIDSGLGLCGYED